MKNKITAVLCILILTITLSACSETERAFLQLFDGMATGIEGRIEGSFEVKFDRQGLNMRSDELLYSVLLDYGKSLFEEAGRNWEEEGFNERLSEDYGEYKDINYDWDEFQLEMNAIVVHYTIDADYQTGLFHLMMTVSFNDQTINFGDLYYSMDEGVFVSGKTLKNIIHYLKPYYNIPKSVRDPKSIFNTKEFQEGLDRLIEEEKYIHIWDGTGGFLGSQLFAMIYDVQNFQGQAPIELIEIYRSLIDCILRNENSFYDAMETIVQGVQEYASEQHDDGHGFVESKKYAVNEETRKLTSLFLEASKDYLQNGTILNPSLEDCEFSYTADKRGNSFAMDIKGEFQYKDHTLVTLHGEAWYEPKDTTIVLPKSVIDANQLHIKILEMEKKVNPAVRIFLSWNTETYMEVYDYWKAWYDYTYGDSDTFSPPEQDIEVGSGEELEWYYDSNYYNIGMFWDYEDRDYLSAEYNKKYTGLNGEGTYIGRELFSLEVHDGDLYVPLRSFCEKLGQEMVWDAESMHFYAVQDGEKVDMDGFIKEGVYYVNAFEFEKLGLVVIRAYSSWSKHNVSIATPDQLIPYDEKDLDEWQRVY